MRHSRAIAPTLGEPPALHLPPQQRCRLANGLDVIIVERHDLPVVDVRFCARGGAAAHDAAAAGTAWMTAELLDQGTRTRSAIQLADEAELLGASLHTRTTWDAVAAGLHVLAPRLEPALTLLADIVTAPTFPVAELERKRQERLATILQELDDPRALASIAFSDAVYGSAHPYGVPVAGTRASMAAVQRADVEAFCARVMIPANAFLVLVGDVDAAATVPMLERLFGHWQGDDVPHAAPGLPLPQPQSGTHIVDRPGAPQSELRIGLPGPPRSTPDHFPLLVANTVLGGAFTSRLNIRLREEKAYTYGASSGFAFRADGGPFVASTAVFTGATADAVATVRAEVERLAQERVPDAELERAKNYVVLGLPRTFETTADIAEHVAEVALHGLGDDYYDRYAERVRSVTADEVRDAAARWIPAQRLITVIAGDAAAIENELASAGVVHVRNGG